MKNSGIGVLIFFLIIGFITIVSLCIFGDYKTVNNPITDYPKHPYHPKSVDVVDNEINNQDTKSIEENKNIGF